LGVYQNFSVWYNYFFGTEGLIVQNFTKANATNETSNATAGNVTEMNATNASAESNMTGGNASVETENTSGNEKGGRKLQDASS
jgi:hypothetical protein